MSKEWPTQLNNVERKSGIMASVNSSEEERQCGMQHFEGVFNNQEEFDAFDVKKTSFEIELIRKINDGMVEFIARYGGVPIKINLENVHIVDRSKMPSTLQLKYLTTTGFFTPQAQAICIFSDLRMDKNKLIKVLVHEMMHFNSFQSIVTRDGESTMNRVGATIYSSKNNKVLFYDIDESIIDELTKRFCLEFLDLTIKNESNELDVALQDSLNKILNANEDKFNNIEEVFSMFVKNVLTGKMKDLAKLIDNTFGAGSFRRSGELSAIDMNNNHEK